MAELNLARFLDWLQNGKDRYYAKFQPPDAVVDDVDEALREGLSDMHIKAGGITGVSVGSLLSPYVIDGVAEAGPVAMPGANVGDAVSFVFDATTPAISTDFEAVITVADQIQQVTDDDLSTESYLVVTIPKS